MCVCLLMPVWLLVGGHCVCLSVDACMATGRWAPCVCLLMPVWLLVGGHRVCLSVDACMATGRWTLCVFVC